MASLPIEYRNAIDVMTTETTCWSSIWVTDEETQHYYTLHGRPQDYKKLNPAEVAYYDGCVYIDLSTVESTIAMPMHPSNTYTIHELQANAKDILHLVQMCIRDSTYALNCSKLPSSRVTSALGA